MTRLQISHRGGKLASVACDPLPGFVAIEEKLEEVEGPPERHRTMLPLANAPVSERTSPAGRAFWHTRIIVNFDDPLIDRHGLEEILIPESCRTSSSSIHK